MCRPTILTQSILTIFAQCLLGDFTLRNGREVGPRPLIKPLLVIYKNQMDGYRLGGSSLLLSASLAEGIG